MMVFREENIKLNVYVYMRKQDYNIEIWKKI